MLSLAKKGFEGYFIISSDSEDFTTCPVVFYDAPIVMRHYLECVSTHKKILIFYTPNPPTAECFQFYN